MTHHQAWRPIAGLLLLLPSVTQAQEVSVRIETAGLYQLDNTVRWIPDPTQPGGRRGMMSRNPPLMKATDLVPLERGVMYGVNLFVQAPTETVNLRRVTRIPFPGVQDPETGKRFMTVETTITLPVGRSVYIGFAYDQAWKLVEGEWILEFWIDGQKVAEKKYLMTKAEGEDGGVPMLSVGYPH